MYHGLPKDNDTVCNLIIPQWYTYLSYPTSPVTNKNTTTGTGKSSNIFLTSYIQLCLFFEDNSKEEVLLSFQFRDDVQDEAVAFLLLYVSAGNGMVRVHIRGNNRDKCST